MSDIDKPTRCEAVYIGADEKEHGCILDTGHRGKCLCAIRANNAIAEEAYRRGLKGVR